MHCAVPWTGLLKAFPARETFVEFYLEDPVRLRSNDRENVRLRPQLPALNIARTPHTGKCFYLGLHTLASGCLV